MFGERREENIFSPKQSAEKRGESPSIPISVLGDHRECESFHSLGNWQKTHLLFYSHRAKHKEKVHEKRGTKDGDRERKGHGMKEKGRARDSREREGAGRRGL